MYIRKLRHRQKKRVAFADTEQAGASGRIKTTCLFSSFSGLLGGTHTADWTVLELLRTPRANMFDLVVESLSFGGHLSVTPGSVTNRWPAPGIPFCFPVTRFTFWEIGGRNSTLLCGLI